MSDELKQIYAGQGLIHNFFDKIVPCDLFRGQNLNEAKKKLPVIYPNPGFTKSDGTVRGPDVFVVEVDGKLIVKGCRTTKLGEGRGVSVFDRIPGFRGFNWYKLPAGTDLPPGIAVTKDHNFPDRPNHFTLAPKDDMPLELFLVYLNALNQYLQKVE